MESRRVCITLIQNGSIPNVAEEQLNIGSQHVQVSVWAYTDTCDPNPTLQL